MSVALACRSVLIKYRCALSVVFAVRKKLFALVALGSGNRFMSCADTGSNRSDGIVLFGNGCPVSGSRTVVDRMPWRSSAVGTTVWRVTPCVRRVPSASPKKNAFPRTIGPPRLPPKSFWRWSGLGAPWRIEKKSFELNLSFRKYS